MTTAILATAPKVTVGFPVPNCHRKKPPPASTTVKATANTNNFGPLPRRISAMPSRMNDAERHGNRANQNSEICHNQRTDVKQ
jgi:hypothetical protein